MRHLAAQCASIATTDVLNFHEETGFKEDPRRAIHEAAHLAAQLAVSSIYMNDAELNALREENIRLRDTSLRYGVKPQFYAKDVL